MGIELLTERHKAQIAGVMSCWDRILLFGTLPKICYAEGMTSYLYERKVRIFDYPRFAEPFRDKLRENAERLAAEHGIEIEFLRKRNVRKDRVTEILAKIARHRQTTNTRVRQRVQMTRAPARRQKAKGVCMRGEYTLLV